LGKQKQNAKQGKPRPTPVQTPQSTRSWVKKSHFKRNFVIVVAVFLIVIVGVYAVSQSAPGSSARPFLVTNSAWKTAPLQDPVTGQTFTLSNFTGKIVVLQFLATYCQYCLEEGHQLVTVQQNLAHDSRASGGVVIVSVDVDPNENVAQLKQYVQSNGFGNANSNPPWRYAKDSTGQLLQSIAGNVDFGSFISLTHMYFIDGQQTNNFMTMQRSLTQNANPASDIVAVVDKLL
jgi:thiol-disulfide isomerase/thioredoxin